MDYTAYSTHTENDVIQEELDSTDNTLKCTLSHKLECGVEDPNVITRDPEQFLVHAKFQILVGILQNSEFCQKLLPIRTEPHSDLLFFSFLLDQNLCI